MARNPVHLEWCLTQRVDCGVSSDGVGAPDALFDDPLADRLAVNKAGDRCGGWRMLRNSWRS